MAASSLLALIDDIASILDDVAVLTKVAAKKTTGVLDDVSVLTQTAAKKTSGVLGDDLALNAQQVTGVKANRELPVVWAVAKGSFINKAILVPAAIAISYFMPWLVTPLLMLGGAYLCFEGFEKVAHKFLHSKEEDAARHAELVKVLADESKNVVAIEKDKIKGAIRTDFILSAEIIAITLGTVQGQPLGTQIAVLSTIAIVITVGVYGLVAGIVKVDDVGLHFMTTNDDGSIKHTIGRGILAFAPYMMKALSIVGTAAMFLVGGGILTHGFPAIHHWVEGITAGMSGLMASLVALSADAVTGIAAGALVLGAVTVFNRLRPKKI